MPRTSLTSIALIGAIMAAGGSASAQFGDQPADLTLPGGGSSVNSAIDTTLHADNFIVPADTVVTQIDWVGYVYNLGSPADITGFWVEIYPDSNPTAGVFGVPDEAPVHTALLPVDPDWITTQVVGVGWLSQTFYHYSTETSINLPAGDYWLHIAAVMANTNRAFVWARHSGGNGDGILARAATTLPENGFSQQSGDLAFLLTAGAATGIEDYIAMISAQVESLDLGVFNAPNPSAASGRRGALANQFAVVVRHIEHERYNEALARLADLSAKIDEWVAAGPERDELQLLVADLTALIDDLT